MRQVNEGVDKLEPNIQRSYKPCEISLDMSFSYVLDFVLNFSGYPEQISV